MTLSLLTLNTGGCASPVKNASICTYVDNIAFNPDIVFLQEINDSSQNSPCWNIWSSYTPICAPSHTRGSGVAILYRSNLFNVVDSSIIFESHILYLKVEFNNVLYHLYNVLIPQDNKVALSAIQCLEDDLVQRKDGVIIIGGDFNTTPNPSLDRFCMPIEHRPKIANALQSVLDSYHLSDVWRRLHPHDKKYSWQRNNPNSINGVSKARLDRFYVPFNSISSIYSCFILPCSLTDHSAISLKIKLPSPQKRGSAFWHLNNSLLEDPNYIDIITQFWSDWQNEKQNFPNILLWWDFGKSHIKSLSQMYGSKLASEKREALIKINKTIDSLQSEPDLSPDILNALAEQRDELNLLLKSQARGALVRSRFQLANEIDTSSSFFYNLEKSNSSSKTISRIRLSSGSITENQSDIKAHIHDFYKNLYKRVQTDDSCFKTISSNLPKLNSEDSQSLDARLTLEEIDTAIVHLENNKSPGLDGLSSEFYQIFWSTLKHDYLSVLNHAISSGTLPHSFRRAVITLIPKKGDLADIANWRPVSLLNNDYKIFAKVLANRLKLSIGQIIHEDQSYCVPGRTIYDNLNLIRDVINFANNNNSQLAIINLDQRKAFDNVDHTYLFNTMKSMGFGDFFISCIKLLYNDAEGLIKVCGSLTAPFPIEKGIRQGCPLSGLLYSIAIEPFLHLLRQRLDNYNFPLPNNTGAYVSVSAYADDISIFVTADEAFDIIQDVYSTFSKSSAACLNYVKSQGLWVGSWTRRIDKPLGFKWNNEGLLFLGVHLGVSNNYVNHNWTKCKEELSKTLSRWSTLSRNLSFKGKILVANQLAASKIFHCLAILSPPHQILSELQDMLVNFIWSNKRHLLKKQLLFQECDKGGLGLASLQARTLTFRMSFLQRFLSLCSHPAYDLCSYNLQKYKHLHFDFQLFLMNLEPKFYYSLPYFYSDILSAWSKCGARIETSYFSLNHVLNVPLNYSFPTSLTVSGNKVLPVRLFACGIKLVKDLIDLTNGSWLQAGDFTFPSIWQRSSLRLLDRELSYVHETLITDFPAFFCTNGLRHSDLPLRDLAARIISPFSVKVNDNTNLFTMSSRILYRLFNRSLNCLSISPFTLWHEIGVLSPSVPINWTENYRLPSSKRDGDIQYKLMHNVLPSLAVLHHINPDIPSHCGWCDERGTILHLFFFCESLQPTLNLLHRLLSCLLPNVKINFELYWTLVSHARGRRREAVRLSNFLITSLKSTFYWLYRTSRFINPLPLWTLRVKNKIILDYEFYKLKNNLPAFNKRWSFNDSLFTIDGDIFTWLI